VNLLPHLPFWAELLVFVASAVTIWVAGIFLSNNTDVLADRLHLGQALGGLILLAVATNLPEIAITYSAAASGQLDVAVSNILGGIAIQTVVLVALDAFGVRQRRPLTYQAASLTLVIEGAVVLTVLVPSCGPNHASGPGAPAARPPVAVWTAEQTAVFLHGVDTDPMGPLLRLIALRGLRRGEAKPRGSGPVRPWIV